jgi:hypothetical protein
VRGDERRTAEGVPYVIAAKNTAAKLWLAASGAKDLDNATSAERPLT